MKSHLVSPHRDMRNRGLADEKPRHATEPPLSDTAVVSGSHSIASLPVWQAQAGAPIQRAYRYDHRYKRFWKEDPKDEEPENHPKGYTDVTDQPHLHRKSGAWHSPTPPEKEELDGDLAYELFARSEQSVKRKVKRHDKKGVQKLVKGVNDTNRNKSKDPGVFGGQSFFHQLNAVEESEPKWGQFKPYPGVYTNTRELTWKDRPQFKEKPKGSDDEKEEKKDKKKEPKEKKKKFDVNKEGFAEHIEPANMLVTPGGSYKKLGQELPKHIAGINAKLSKAEKEREFLEFLQAPHKELPSTLDTGDGQLEEEDRDDEFEGGISEEEDTGGVVPIQEDEDELVSSSSEDESEREQERRKARGELETKRDFLGAKHLIMGVEPFRREGVFTANHITLARELEKDKPSIKPFVGEEEGIMTPSGATRWHAQPEINKRQLKHFNEQRKYLAKRELPKKKKDFEPLDEVAEAFQDLEEKPESKKRKRGAVNSLIGFHIQNEGLDFIGESDYSETDIDEDPFSFQRVRKDVEPDERPKKVRKVAKSNQVRVGRKKQTVVADDSQEYRDYEAALKLTPEQLEKVFIEDGQAVSRFQTYLKEEHGLDVKGKFLAQLLHEKGLKRGGRTIKTAAPFEQSEYFDKWSKKQRKKK